MDADEFDDPAELYNTAAILIGRIAFVALTIAFTTTLALVAYSAWALEPPTEKWALVSCCSWHQERNKYRELNPGIGIEYGWQDLRATAINYTNSNGRDSVLLGIAYRPIRFMDDKLRFGLTAGKISGYSDKITKAVIPSLAIEGKTWGTNIWFIPPIRYRETDVKAVIGVAFKRRF